MLKFFIFVGSLLITSSLAMGMNTCQKFSDQQYRDILTAHPFTVPVNEMDGDLVKNFHGTATITFKKNGVFLEHLDYTCNLGSGTVDTTANWSVRNATLYRHIIVIKHSDTGNKELNNYLDARIKEAMQAPDFIERLSECSNPNFLNRSELKSTFQLSS